MLAVAGAAHIPPMPRVNRPCGCGCQGSRSDRVALRFVLVS